jgi:oligosaccharide reducing-end xylanase
VGPEVDEQNAMILFVPGVMPHPFTDPSYHLPAFYELWARWGPVEDRAFWAHAAEASRTFFVKATRPTDRPCADYANFDGTPPQPV